MTARIAAVVLLAATAAVAACGKKGPPLAPIVLVPARPDALTAARRGDTVHIELVVPGANTDGSRPANVTRVDVYGFTGSTAVTDEDLLRLGRRIGTFEVNEPPDPDEPASRAAAPSARSGVDQGATVRLTETLTPEIVTPIEIPPARPALVLNPAAAKPAAAATMRTYLAIASAGRRTSPPSRRAAVPLGAAPATPASPTVTYNEQAITIAWPAPAEGETSAYHVYEVGPAAVNDVPAETRLTSTPAAGASFDDARIEWGATRCYTIRTVATVDAVPVESDAPPPACVELQDTFAPLPPSGLTAVPSVGAVSLIWDAATAPDLAGYLVLKGAPGGPLAPVTPAPIAETTYRDTVPPGTRVAYAVQAVDKAGNVSAPSATVEETSR